MPKRSTHAAIFLLKYLMEIYVEACKNFNMVFVDLQKEKKEVHLKYNKLIKDINDEVVISVRTTGGITSEFPITICLYQGSTLSSYLFYL